MIELRDNVLHVGFPEVHPRATLQLSFPRTLRVPDDNQDYPLPAGLGRFPVHAVDDHAVPAHWREHGGVFLPMHQAEALWISFGRFSNYPMAIKVAAGKINAVTGAGWDNALHDEPQDYLVAPEQPWLDGFHATRDIVRQFVAIPLGQGVTAEEQLTGEATWGGLQIIAYPMRAEEYRRRFEMRVHEEVGDSRNYLALPAFCRKEAQMGLAPGGRIRQEIAQDPYGLDVWDTSVHSRCFVHLLNAEHYREVTGRAPPPTPVTAEAYKKAGIPWFDFYNDGPTLGGSAILAGLDSLAGKLIKQGKVPPDDAPIVVGQTIILAGQRNPVRDGVF